MDKLAFAKDYITTWEGGGKKGYFSVDPDDNGNWYLAGAKTQKKGQGELIGSNYGVTAAAMHAAYPTRKITPEAMSILTLAEAADIALRLYYFAPGLDKLAWNRVTASAMDFGWGVGATTGVMCLQKFLGLTADGNIGPMTIAKYAAFIAEHGEVNAAAMFYECRKAKYERVVQAVPSNAKYLKGWLNRSRYFLKGHVAKWWERWDA